MIITVLQFISNINQKRDFIDNNSICWVVLIYEKIVQACNFINV